MAKHLADHLSRRRLLEVGAVSAFGPLVAGTAAPAADPVRSRKSCIVLFLLGGPPQHETWDPKPLAPVEIRGDLQPISSSVPGIAVGELMPQTAELLEHVAVLRGVSTGDNAHSTSGYAMTTGYSHTPKQVEGAKPGAPNDHPCLGAVVKSLRSRASGLPTAVTIPEIAYNDGKKTWPGQDAGFLGRPADPWVLDCDPSSEDFSVSGLTPPPDVSALRFHDRRQVLAQLDRRLERVSRDEAIAGHETWRRQALELLGKGDARRVFDLSLESDKTRDRYGRNRFGQSVLLARRLVEAGVSFVRVNWTRIPGALNNGHWDTHRSNSEALRKHLMPRIDQTYSALLTDLLDRGLLDDTLVVWTGEFGRTPKINGNGGRDHWGNAFSLALAGGGVRGGQVHGRTDARAAEPVAGRVGPADVLATIHHALGHGPETTIRDREQRPLPVTRGKAVRSLF